MRLNENCAIYCPGIILVPYKDHHVIKYHQWMENEELRELTASERLTLEQEYEMQNSWHTDENKCTFIVLERLASYSAEQTETDAMVGDVNVFIDDDGCAELEVMIAEPAARGRGFGKQAVLAMIIYCAENVKTTTFVVKIGLSNQPSITLFTKLGFAEVSRSEVFRETTLQLNATAEKLEEFRRSLKEYLIADYQHNFKRV